MTYWLDLFTGTTWDEFRAAGAKTSGFRPHNENIAKRIKPGDVFLCYLTGVKRWVGLLEVTGQLFHDEKLIWKDDIFPVRLPVKPLVLLEAENGVPMDSLKGKLSFYTLETEPGKWSGFVRRSPSRYEKRDGETIAEAIREANEHPVSRPVDPKKLNRSANLYKLKAKGEGEPETVVTVPDEEDEEDTVAEQTSHTEIQWRLLDLGSQMGLRVWAPKSDRGREWSGNSNGSVSRMLDTLPTQFDEVTNRTIENIDVLWLKGNAIVAAFEVEHSTSIYSGLLRMSDLLKMQPNIDINLYLVAPDERFAKFKREVPRATFALGGKPLHSVCRFLPYSQLCNRLEEAKNFLSHLRPDFLDDIAEFYDPAEEFDA